MNEDSATLTKPEDAGKGQAGLVKRWLMALSIAGKQEKTWRKTAQQTVERYRQEGADYDAFKAGGSKFNILNANTEVTRPALYHSTPKPDVRRRYRDEDPVGKEASVILERGLSFSVDSYDFDQVMNLAVLDLLLPGRAVTRVRYEPTLETVTPPPELPQPMGKDEMGAPIYAPENLDEMGQPVPIQGEPFEKITYQAVSCEHVAWKDFRHGPGRVWEEVEWEAFQHKLTLEQITELCGSEELAKRVTLDCSDDDSGDDKDKDGDEANLFKRGIVWEVWDKKTRTVHFIAPSVEDRTLKSQKDELKLEGFYPNPRPMYALESTDSLVPVELFKLYKDQADELDRVTQRINALLKACKVRGIYDSTLAAVATAMQAEDNVFTATTDASIALMANGGDFNKAIWIFPIEKLVTVLRELYVARDQIKATIYEITGLSDILRGESDASETLGAQQIKAQSGSRRMRRLQKEVQRYARDLMRLKAEIMAEHFEPFMFELMSGKPPSAEALQMLKSDITRSYRIDIETDSTIAEDEQRDQKAMTDLLDGIARFVAGVGPVVQAGYMSVEVAMAMLKSVVRRFRLGREVEDALENAQAELQKKAAEPKPPSPEQVAAEAQKQEMLLSQQAHQAEMDARAQAAQLAQRVADADEARKAQAFAAEEARKEREFEANQSRLAREADLKNRITESNAAVQAEALRKKNAAQPKQKVVA